MSTMQTIIESVLNNSVNLVADVTVWKEKDRDAIHAMLVAMYDHYGLRCEELVSHRRTSGDEQVLKFNTSQFEGVAKDVGKETYVARSKGSKVSGGNEVLIKCPDELVAAAAFLQWYRANQGWAPAPRPIAAVRAMPAFTPMAYATITPSQDTVDIMPNPPTKTHTETFDQLTDSERLARMQDASARLSVLRGRRDVLLTELDQLDEAIESVTKEVLRASGVESKSTKLKTA